MSLSDSSTTTSSLGSTAGHPIVGPATVASLNTAPPPSSAPHSRMPSPHIAPAPVDDDDDMLSPPHQGASQADLDKMSQKEAFQAERKRRWEGGVDWGVAFWIALLHVGALFAPWTFTWQALVLTVFLGWMNGGLGICLGFHRLLTHASFKTYKPVKWFFAWLGGLAGEGSAVHWVANHRKHHAHSDHVGDPHSPVDGPWWAHMFWFMPKMTKEEYREHHRRWAPDLAKDRFLIFLDRTFILWHIGMTAGIWGLGYWIGGSSMALSFVIWGVFVRLCYVLHSTWFVNSATHLWGYRNYNTTDESTNLWWVAAITYGEGWHNNHHAYPRMARHGHKWWEVDMTFMTIKLLEKVGLAWDVVDHQHEKKAHLHTVRTSP